MAQEMHVYSCGCVVAVSVVVVVEDMADGKRSGGGMRTRKRRKRRCGSVISMSKLGDDCRNHNPNDFRFRTPRTVTHANVQPFFHLLCHSNKCSLVYRTEISASWSICFSVLQRRSDLNAYYSFCSTSLVCPSILRLFSFQDDDSRALFEPRYYQHSARRYRGQYAGGHLRISLESSSLYTHSWPTCPESCF